MGDSLYDMSLKELEEYFPVHAVMQASASKPKTPYQLDLEVKDRKPSIIPKVGDKVKIKSREWYEKWKDEKGWVHLTSDDCIFNQEMKDLCGRVLTVQEIYSEFPHRRWMLNMDNHYWLPESFEEVYPVEEQADVKPKTPYQLDLEVKDRKPSIVPKVGDKVKIKSREWYENWKVGDGYVDVPEYITPPMAELCGEVLTVEEFRIGRFKMKEDKHKWAFSLEMFEEVYPVQEQLRSEFPRIDLNSPYLFQSPYEVKGSELIFSKKEKERFLQQLRNKWGINPKLKQVKTTHLIRLRKL